MSWVKDKYYYSTRVLKAIAENYTSIYNGIELREGRIIINLWSLAEYKADFDRALRGIGRGQWTGEIRSFRDFRSYGRLQQILIADILGINDYELMGRGFYDIPRLRGYAYYLMKKQLNG